MWLVLGAAIGCAANPTVQLSNGLKFPLVGFGTAGGVGAEAVRWAYNEGVRLFDTAQAKEWYDEASVAEGLRGLPRDSYWLTTKLHPRDLGYESTLNAFPNSLKELRTSYIDLFLIHFPRCAPTICKSSPGDFHDSWRAMEKLYRDKVVKAIGVSNFDARDLKALLSEANVVPHVVQNFFDPFHQDSEVRMLCERYGIVYQGYSTLGTQWVMREGGENPVLTDANIVELGEKYNRSPAQIVLNWAVARGVAVIPRSGTKENIAENADIGFKMDEADLERLDGLDRENIEDDPEAIEVTFVNAGQDSVEVMWRGPNALHLVTDLEPGERFNSQSYHGHNFVVQVDGQPRYAFGVSTDYPVYHLEDEAARPHTEL